VKDKSFNYVIVKERRGAVVVFQDAKETTQCMNAVHEVIKGNYEL
jgi:hypothetical protein